MPFLSESKWLFKLIAYSWQGWKDSYTVLGMGWECRTMSTEHTWDCSYTMAPGVSWGREGADSRAAQTDSRPFFTCENAIHRPLQDSIALSPHRGSDPARPVWQSRFHRPLSGQRSHFGLRGARTSKWMQVGWGLGWVLVWGYETEKRWVSRAIITSSSHRTDPCSRLVTWLPFCQGKWHTRTCGCLPVWGPSIR